jgi:multisubunit Na+/H+ antiporter MnhC subunit
MKTKSASSIYLTLLVVSVALLRVFQPLMNFTPLGAVFLFGGSLATKNKWNFMLPLLSLLITDVLIQGIVLKGEYGFPLYQGWFYVYLSFVLMSIVGAYLFKKYNAQHIIYLSILTTSIHWVVSNFGVWMSATNPLYTKDLEGFILCYVAAIPFEWNLLASTLFYTTCVVVVYKYYLQTLFNIQWND